MNNNARILTISCALALSATGASAQCENKSGFAKLACQTQTNITGPYQAATPDPKTFLSTSFADTIHGETLPANIDPKMYRPLTELERSEDGAFILKPGMYEAYVQSYTLDLGDANSTKAGGYYPAPIKGTKAKIVASILKQIELHPDVGQVDVQQLLLFVVQGTDLDKMPPSVQQTVARVCPKDIIRQMQASVQAKQFQQGLMNLLNAHAKDKNGQQKQQLPDFTKQLEQMRQQAEANATFNAQPDAAAPVVRGTWVLMPGGFYLRYLPDGYAKTRLQLMVPDESITNAQMQITFDPTQFLAVLGQAPSERIGISLRQAR